MFDPQDHRSPTYSGCMARAGWGPVRKGPPTVTVVFGASDTLIIAPGPSLGSMGPYPFHLVPQGVIPHVRWL